MDKATVIALAKRTDLWQMLETYSGEFGDGFVEADCLPDLMAFVTAIEDHITWSDTHTCHPGCNKPPCVAMREAVLAEREACAKVCEDFGKTLEVDVGDCFAEAIRSRT